MTAVQRSFCALLAACFPLALPLAAKDADVIYRGGAILTMEETVPRVEALAVRDGRILAVGSETDVLAHRGEATEMVDLDGHALLPGFFDAHGHVLFGGLQALSVNLLAPPDGEVTEIGSLQTVLVDWMAENEESVRAANFVIGFGYDNASLAEHRHPTRSDLDAVSSDVPIYLVHQSGHFGAGNSLALEIAGIGPETADPPGGIIRRDGAGIPDGVLEETAHFDVLMKLLGQIGSDGMKEMARAGAQLWARYGYTTAEEGRSNPGAAEILRAVAAESGIAIDVVTYPDVLIDRDWIAANVSENYENGFRVAGAKLTIDGSPQGFTAWRDRPYVDPVGDYPPGYVGYPAATSEQVLDAIDWAYQQGIQIITHSNGEAASDLLLAAHEAAQEAHGRDGDLRPVLVHGQFLRQDQVDGLKRLGITPSLFPMHTFYWGDWHREHTVGPERADNISPTGWVRARGMRFSTHHDAPVAFPDSMRVLDATVTRRSRSGDILGPNQRVDVETALKAMTIWPAWHHHEDAEKGSLAQGKLADLVILSGDPTAIDPEDLDTLTVLETIKEGVTVYAADGDRGESRGSRGRSHAAIGRALRAAAADFETPADAPVWWRSAVARSGHDGSCVARYLHAAMAGALTR